ncbi:MAG TPA: MMPL family transporter [Actinomycetota bacterium]|nr:MMPL family transporter [Actinomycetota bacterium]
MFEGLADFVVRRRLWIVAVTGVFFLVAGAVGGGVADRLSTGGFEDPNAESTEAEEILKTEFGTQTPNVVLLVSAEEGTVDDPEVAEAGAALTEELAAQEGVSQVASYWSLKAPPLKSKDSTQALVIGVIDGSDDRITERMEELSPEFTRHGAEVDVAVGGFAEVYRQMSTTIEEDLVRAETIALPITMVLLVVVFGSVVAAGLPLLIGGLAIVGTFLILTVLASLTQVSIFALNLTTSMGLGLAIDYSLFVVSRYREELRGGLEPHDAVKASVRTAGRTVAFSGLTVALSLGALLVFPLAFLRSFAYAGIAVVLLAALASVVFLPAVLALLGHRVDSLRLWHRKEAHEGEGFWHGLAMTVMRRPLIVATAVIAFLAILGAPFFGVKWGQADDRSLPAEASSHQVSQQIREGFDVNSANSLSVVAPDAGADPQEITEYATRLSQADGVFAVQGLTGTFAGGRRVQPPDEISQRFANADGGTWLSVIPAVEAFSDAGEDFAREVRAVPAPWDVKVTGPSATLVDTQDSIFSKVPLAGGLIAAATFVLLFLMFGSVLVPLKAIVLNMLSLSATFGALVWVFQEGNLSGVLDFTATGFLEVSTPILMFCIAFGLSMDYEVFLLSRVKEEYDRSGDNTSSVALGLERTGRIVTAAALLLSIVFIATATSGVSIIKMFGIGLTLAVVADATLIRATLVPAFMRLAGRANWWAPGWMRRLHDRFGISEGAPVEPAPQGGVS